MDDPANDAWPDEWLAAWRFVADPSKGPPRSRAIRVRLLLKYARRELGLIFAWPPADARGLLLDIPAEAWPADDDGPTYQPTVKHKPKEPEMRVCPFPGCTRQLQPTLFACRSHWFSLTKAQRDEVWLIYGQWKRGEIDGDELRKRQKRIVDEATPARA